MAPTRTTQIEVDLRAAEILRRAQERARARGQTLGSYLERALPQDADVGGVPAPQRRAWDEFVEGRTSVVSASVPPGHVADDSRESIYDDRT